MDINDLGFHELGRLLLFLIIAGLILPFLGLKSKYQIYYSGFGFLSSFFCGGF